MSTNGEETETEHEEVSDGLVHLLQRRDEEDKELLADAVKEARENMTEGEEGEMLREAPEEDSRRSADRERNPQIIDLQADNQKISQTKSTDRIKRVQRIGKYEACGRSNSSSAIRRSFIFGCGDDDDDVDKIKFNDYGAIMVKAKMSRSSKKRSKYMVVVRFISFGKRGEPQVEQVWDAEDDTCRLLVSVMHVEETIDSNEKPALYILNKVGEMIKNVNRTCVIPIRPVLELVKDDDSETDEPKSRSLFRMDDLKAAHATLVLKGKYVELKKKVIDPILVKSIPIFVATAERESLVCNICNPPM